MKAIERLYEYLRYRNIKPTRFEKEIGLSNGYLGTQLKRSSDLGETIVLKIIDYCLDLDLVWLLTGRGEMLQNTSNLAPEAPIIQIETPAEASIFHMLYKEKDVIIKEKDAKIEAQAKEIGKLEAEVEGLEEENKKLLETLKSIPKHAPVSSVESA